MLKETLELLHDILSTIIAFSVFYIIAQYIILYNFPGKYTNSLAYVVTGLVAFFIYFITVYVASYGRQSLKLFDGEVLLTTLVVVLMTMALVYFLNTSASLLFSYFQNNQVNKEITYKWAGLFFILIVLPVATFQIKTYLKLLNEAEYVQIHLNIQTYPDLPIIINELKFINSKTGAEESLSFQEGEWEQPKSPPYELH